MLKKIQNDEIVIGFSTAVGFKVVAMAIRAFEGTAYSHVYMRYYSSKLDRDMIYQSNIDNVHFTNKEHFLEKNKIIEEYAFKVTPEQRIKIQQKCIDRLSLQYGSLQLIGMAYAQIMRKLGMTPKNPFWDGEKTQVCSELVGHILIELGYEIDPKALEIEGPKWLNCFVKQLCRSGKCRKL